MAEKNTEKQTVGANRQKIIDRHRKNKPDENWDDDEVLMGQIATDYDNYDKSAQERERFNQMMSENEYAPGLFAGAASGKNADGSDFTLEGYLWGELGGKVKDAMGGDDDAAEELHQLMVERIASHKSSEALQESLDKQNAELDALIDETGADREEVKKIFDWIYAEDGLLKRAGNFELTKEDMQQIMKIVSHDNDVAAADEAGYKRGRNERINMGKGVQTNERPVNLGGGGGAGAGKKEDPTLAALGRMKNF